MTKHAVWMTELRDQMKHRISENMAFFKSSAGVANFTMTSVEGS